MVKLPKLKEKPIQLYEVIRVIDNIPLFLEDHLGRLYRTAEMKNIPNVPLYQEIRKEIMNLIKDKNLKMGNLKLTINVKGTNSSPEMELDFIPHFYPTEDKYKKGVKTGVLKAERPNPQAKIQNLDLRNKANLIMSRENVYEVLLIDHQDHITEGSRSNVFFIKGKVIITSPDEKVLQGITREKILQLCEDHKIKVLKREIPFAQLNQFKGAFLTGSSPKVLPIYQINEQSFNPGLPLIRRIIKLYDQEIEEYLNHHRTDLNADK